MRQWTRTILLALGAVVACVPVAFLLAILLLPVWRWIEATYGIESVGHSGPADWCFWAVYACLLLPSLWLVVRRRRVPDAATATPD